MPAYITGVWERSPQRGPAAQPLVKGQQRAKPGKSGVDMSTPVHPWRRLCKGGSTQIMLMGAPRGIFLAGGGGFKPIGTIIAAAFLARRSLSIERKRYWYGPVTYPVYRSVSVSVCRSGKGTVAKRLTGYGCRLRY